MCNRNCLRITGVLKHRGPNAHTHIPNRMSKRQRHEDASSGARVCHPAPAIKCSSLQADGSFKEFNLSDHKGRLVAAARACHVTYWASSVYGE